ncbi:Galectin, partial [Trichostrongylus colubriformis]
SVPSIHPIHEELRSGCAINVHGRINHGEDGTMNLFHLYNRNPFQSVALQNPGSFVVELLSSSSAVMSLKIITENNELIATSYTDSKKDKVIELNGKFVGCFVPIEDVRSVKAIGVKGNISVNIMTIEGFPFLKSWNTVQLEWTQDTLKQLRYPDEKQLKT